MSFSVELYSHGSIKPRILIEEEIFDDVENNAKYLALFLFNIRKTPWINILSEYLNNYFDHIGDPRALDFKYKFLQELNDLVKKTEIAVPATKVLQ